MSQPNPQELETILEDTIRDWQADGMPGFAGRGDPADLDRAIKLAMARAWKAGFDAGRKQQVSR